MGSAMQAISLVTGLLTPVFRDHPVHTMRDLSALAQALVAILYQFSGSSAAGTFENAWLN
jgi:hypothetical protein